MAGLLPPSPMGNGMAPPLAKADDDHEEPSALSRDEIEMLLHPHPEEA